MICLHCGSELTTSEFQARSADEASSILISCPNCPLDVSKLGLELPINKPHIHIKRFDRLKRIPNSIYSSETTVTRWVTLKLDTYPNIDTVVFQSASCSNALDQHGNLMKSYTSGMWQHKSSYETRRLTIAPSADIVDMVVCDDTVLGEDMYVDFEFAELNADMYQCFLVKRVGNLSIWLNTDSDNSDSIHDAIHWLYLRYYTPSSLRNYIPTAILSSMSNLSARAYDAHPDSIDETEYQYGPKVDGERMWLTRIGVVWLTSRRLKGHEIKGWYIDKTIDSEMCSPYGPVIDYELLLGHNDISIDVLMDENSKVSSERRNLSDIQQQMDLLRLKFPILNRVETREFRSSIGAAQDDCKVVKYPTDGIVGIPHHGVDMIKVKSIKSMELEVINGNILCSEDKLEICQITDGQIYEDGTIIEVGFQIINQRLHPIHFFVRPDKTKANSSEAISNIVASGLSKVSDNIIRKTIWRYSNEIRAEIHNKVNKITSGKRIVLDIGTGDGQSIDTYITNETLSYIFIEPDEAKCINLRRRLKIRHVYTDPRSILSYIPQMKAGKLKYHILNCKLIDLLDDRDIIRELMPQLRCAVACFSAQFIASNISTFILASVPFMGCCYMYDNVESGEYILHEGGLIMRRLDEERAMVQWGKDNPYFEPALEKFDLPPHGLHVSKATDMVEFQSQRETMHLKSTCDHISILLTL
jgi:hypothetical protein